MSVRYEIKGFDRLVSRLRGMVARASRDPAPRVTVGYTAGYAVYVHENLQANHPVGQAKFLEAPARRLEPEMGRVVYQVLRRGGTMAQACVAAGLLLQRESQKLCPVDTGFLKNSAFTRLEPPGG